MGQKCAPFSIKLANQTEPTRTFWLVRVGSVKSVDFKELLVTTNAGAMKGNGYNGATAISVALRDRDGLNISPADVTRVMGHLSLGAKATEADYKRIATFCRETSSAGLTIQAAIAQSQSGPAAMPSNQGELNLGDFGVGFDLGPTGLDPDSFSGLTDGLASEESGLVQTQADAIDTLLLSIGEEIHQEAQRQQMVDGIASLASRLIAISRVVDNEERKSRVQAFWVSFQEIAVSWGLQAHQAQAVAQLVRQKAQLIERQTLRHRNQLPPASQRLRLTPVSQLLGPAQGLIAAAQK
jgi:hypothetical protein